MLGRDQCKQCPLLTCTYRADKLDRVLFRMGLLAALRSKSVGGGKPDPSPFSGPPGHLASTTTMCMDCLGLELCVSICVTLIELPSRKRKYLNSQVPFSLLVSHPPAEKGVWYFSTPQTQKCALQSMYLFAFGM